MVTFNIKVSFYQIAFKTQYNSNQTLSVAFVWVCRSVEFYKLILKFMWKGKKEEKNSPKILGTRLKTYLEKLALSKLILKPY